MTVMPTGASSSAQVRAMPNMPDLVAEYTVRVARPSAARDESSTMRPKRAARIAGSTACTSWIAATKCSSTSASRSASCTSATSAGRITPALWISVVTA